MSADATGKKVLIVDDFEENVEILKEHLEASGFAVDVAYDGESALEVIGRAVPDVILLDVMLPRMDGYQALESIRKNAATESTPVVIMTAYTSRSTDGDRKEALKNGAAAFLRKPFGLDELVQTLNDLLA